MSNDVDWVEDVRRWCLAGTQAPQSRKPELDADVSAVAELGDEAAHPAHQSRYCTSAPRRQFGDLK